MDPRPALRSARPLVALVALALLASWPAAAGAQEVDAASLEGVLDGEVDGIAAEATTAFSSSADDPDDMRVTVEVTNATGAPATLAVPFGTLLATDEQGDQTVAVAGPADDPTLAAVAASGGTPQLALPAGTSTHELLVHCTEADDGAPNDPTPLRALGVATEPLPTVLRALTADPPSPAVAQEAVWWVTDDATLPVPAELAPYLRDVDTAAFAADPHRVVPDTGYAPRWARAGLLDESFTAPASSGDGADGPGLALLLWLVLGSVVAVVAVVAASRSRSGDVTPVAATRRAAGWYPDPWSPGGRRWWDGQGWTAETQRRP